MPGRADGRALVSVPKQGSYRDEATAAVGLHGRPGAALVPFQDLYGAQLGPRRVELHGRR